ncbi:MAG TPA: Hsp70 family protein, partial [Byssovorax sp.]
MSLLEIFDPKAAPRPIGIDLGTTNSLVARVRDGKPFVIADCNGDKLLPSAVAYDARGGAVVGREALRRATEHPHATIVSVKRFMGRGADDAETKRLGAYAFAAPSNADEAKSVRFDVGSGRALTPVEVSADILRALRQTAEDELRTLGPAVITVPAYFDDAQRQATKDAGRLAGLDVIRLLNEPTAAALAYGLDKLDSDQTVFVFDLGGGTFDVTIMKIESHHIRMIASNGDHRLGGKDWDDVIVNWVAEEFDKQ